MSASFGMRDEALIRALEYHHGFTANQRPTAEEILETAQKFLGFLLVEKGAQEIR